MQGGLTGQKAFDAPVRPAAGARSGGIDHLRGLAIVLVLLHHFNITYALDDTGFARAFGWNVVHAVCRNGNYAVTIFFVVSGYLITSNAVNRWGRLADIGMASFYRRRAARILPCVLLLLVTVNSLAATGIGIFQNHPEFGCPVSFWIVDAASLTFWMNVLMAHRGWCNYVLCVQWSLAVEEVFYLAFPLLCILLRRERALLLVWAGFVVIGPIWRATHQASEYEALNAYLACFDGIALGCGAAVLSRRIPVPEWGLGPMQVVAGLLMAVIYVSAGIGDTGVYGVSLMAGATAILLAAGAQTVRGRPPWMLAPLRFFGRLSYELYLFHLVVLAGLQTIWPPGTGAGDRKLWLLAAFLSASIALAKIISVGFSEPLKRRLGGEASMRIA